ncbi:glycoside hydrolase family 2 TIM barrel-domain containing protein [Flammeovirga sp. OC4]|uniref:glycoside hydrolase family 2 TIM barrel-domain containing protein n=1 Tax=Flammeovirga sp. OC4 TaxID=1382345 RepID=UPI0005C70B8A|nr:glycoside hydrolase family 2 TIM barrel-domain containing protein [Flammeovirga sp. OC4]
MSVLKVNLLLALLLFQSVQLYAQNKINFNADWSFQLEDSAQFTLSNYSTDHWRKLNLPHDWTIEKDFSNEFEGCTAFSSGGIGWYSKTFETPTQKEQKCFVVFDGVYNNAEFWVNGMKMGAHPYGYAPIYFDMTDYLHQDGTPNRIMVRVDHSRYADSRWYTGSGIYRNVHLVVTEDVLIPVWGTFVTTPKVTKKSATVDVKVDLLNTRKEGVNSKIQFSIVDQQGAEVYQTEEAIQLNADEKETYQHTFEIQNPQLWGIDQPHLYQAKIKLYNNGTLAQTENVTFGIRKLFFDKDKGFFLNDEPVKIKGVCLHHDAGLVGTAVPKDVWRQKLTLLKEGGCNAIRTSHNPASDEFLDLCDELGLLVQNEFYDEWDLPKDKRYNMHDKEVDYITRGHSEHFQKWAKTDLENTMLSSRNHPSIFQWSIGNEIEWTYPGNRGATGIFKETNKDDKIDWTLWRTEIPPHTPEEVRAFWKAFPEQTYNIGTTAKKLADWTRALDTTRYVTANCILPTSSFETGYTDVLDVVGFSYKPHKYDYFKETYPHKVMMGTENVPRWYEWKAAVERDYIAGIFLWTGIDYLGERRNREWPLKATPHGLLDTAGFPRASFYMFKALWREDIPVISMYTQSAQKSIYKVNEEGAVVEKKKGYWELAPREWQEVNSHWNYEKGEKTIVEVYANCDEVELFQNGKSLGVQYLKDQEDYTYKWAVDFKKGKLEAKGKRNGEKTSVSLQTVDKPFAIQITADKTNMLSNNTDVVKLVAQLVDKKGKAVKYLEEEVTFEIEGLHRFLGTDAGDTRKIINYKHHSRETVNGQCLMMLQSTENPSTVKVTAYAKNKQLGSNEVIININQNSTVEQ